jgi:hypothetical protein
VRRYRPARKVGRVVLGYLDERAAHGGLPVLHQYSLRLERIAFSFGEGAFRWPRSLREDSRGHENGSKNETMPRTPA